MNLCLVGLRLICVVFRCLGLVLWVLRLRLFGGGFDAGSILVLWFWFNVVLLVSCFGLVFGVVGGSWTLFGFCGVVFWFAGLWLMLFWWASVWVGCLCRLGGLCPGFCVIAEFVVDLAF